jgi:hypothetical protein
LLSSPSIIQFHMRRCSSKREQISDRINDHRMSGVQSKPRGWPYEDENYRLRSIKQGVGEEALLRCGLLVPRPVATSLALEHADLLSGPNVEHTSDKVVRLAAPAWL